MPRAIIGTPSVSVLTEDATVGAGLLAAVGTIPIIDTDPGQQAFRFGVTPVGPTLGAMLLLPNGTYLYLVSNASVQFLGAGETRIETFRVTSIDGTTANVSFTIRGVNDAAIIGNPTVVNVTEDVNVAGGLLRATGTISISDADQNQSLFSTSVSAVGTTLGSLTLAANGAYTYSVTNTAVQFLGAGQTRTESFVIRSVDGTSKTVSFVVNGQNDAAVIGDPLSASVTEDVSVNAAGRLVATGRLSILDADQGQAAFRTTVTSSGPVLGTLTLAANGVYTYSVANSAVQFLNTGQARVDRFVVTALDGTTKTISFTINGLNEGAVIGNPNNASVTEDFGLTAGNLTATGTLPIGGNAPGTPAFTFTGVTPVAGALGTLTLAANGAYTYSVNNSLDGVQSLGAGQTRIDSFTVRASDGTTKVINFTINGVNDVAQIFPPAIPGNVTEDTGAVDGVLRATGNLTIRDADQGQAIFSTTTRPQDGTLGTLTLQPNGAFTYSVANAAVQSLAAGETRTERFTVTSADGGTTATVTLTITGTNDAVQITTVDPVGTVTEDAAAPAPAAASIAAAALPPGNVVSGRIDFTDPDLSDTHVSSFSGAPGTLGLGTFAVDPVEEAPNAADGSVRWTYTLDNALANFLARGQTATDVYRVIINDGKGGGTSTDVRITVVGANDAVTITGVEAPGGATVTEDAPRAFTTLTIGFTDPDLLDSHTAAVDYLGTEETLGTVNSFVREEPNAAVGVVLWNYQLDNARAQFLAAGQAVAETYRVTIDDGQGSTASTRITVTIVGSNDPVTITSRPEDLTGTVVEDGGAAPVVTSAFAVSDAIVVAPPTLPPVASGVIAFTDPDLIDTHRASFTGPAEATPLGTFALGDVDEAAGVADGSVRWTYTLDSATANFLAEDEVVTEIYTVTIDDLEGSTATTAVTITITGSNDPVTITSRPEDLTGTVVEDAAPPLALVALAAAVPASTVASGRIDFTDPDLSDTHVASVGTTPETRGLGTFALGAVNEAANAADGFVTWTYTLDGARADFLASGETATDVYSVAITDGKGGGSSADVRITVVGTNDPVTILEDESVLAGTVVEDDLNLAEAPSLDGEVSVAEASGITATGRILFNDPDLSDIHGILLALRPVESFGFLNLTTDFTTAPNGDRTIDWSYALDNGAAQRLGAGETVTELYGVSIEDPSRASATTTITITIRGVNDAVVITEESVTSGTVTEDALPPLELALAVSDDIGPPPSAEARGTIVFDDPDLIDTHTAVVTGRPTEGLAFGRFGITEVSEEEGAAGGSVGWTYTLPFGSADALAQGESVTETYTVAISDGKGSTTATNITITIVGTNDDVAITGGVLDGAVTEDGMVLIPSVAALIEDLPGAPPPTASGEIVFDDPDLTDAHTATVTARPETSLGTFTVGGVEESPDTTGGTVAWTFTLDNDLANFLAAGESVTETYEVTVADGYGGSDTTTISIRIDGSNDPVTITESDLSATLTEDADGPILEQFAPPPDAILPLAATVTGTVATGRINFTDPDWSDIHTYDYEDLSGSDAIPLGVFELSGPTEDDSSADGFVTWTYTLDNDQAQVLGAGETEIRDYRVTIFDGFGSDSTTVTIAILGVNDAPDTPTFTTLLETTEAGALLVAENTTGVIATVSAFDIDRNDTVTYSIDGGDGDLIWEGVTINAETGVLSITAPLDFEDPLFPGNLYTVRVVATDSQGATSFTDVSVQVTDVVEGNRPPVAVDDSDRAILFTDEETAIDIDLAFLLLNDRDPDGDTLRVVSVRTADAQGGGTVEAQRDGDGFLFGSVTYRAGTNTAEGYNGTTGTASFGDESGPGFFYTVSDGDGGTSEAFVRVIVQNVNDPVVARDDLFARSSTGTQTVTVTSIIGNDLNPDPGGALTITRVLDSSGVRQGLTEDGSGVIFSFGNGTSFTYTVADEGGATSTASINFNTAPTAVGDVVNVNETAQQGDFGARVPGSDYIFIPASQLLDNDFVGSFDVGQTLTLAQPQVLALGDAIQQVVFNLFQPGAYVYLKEGDFSGETAFTYRVRDNGGPNLFSADATVTLNVLAGNDVPIAVDDGAFDRPAFTLDEDTAITIDRTLVLGNDYDEEGEATGAPLNGLSIASASSPFGSVAVLENGNLQFTPFANYNSDGVFSLPFISYTVRDAGGAGVGPETSAPAQLYLSVTGTDDPIDARDFRQSVGGGESVFIPLATFLANTSGPDGGVRLTAVAGVTGGGVALVDADDNGVADGASFFFDGGAPYVFTYTVTDADGDTDTGIVTLVPQDAVQATLYFNGSNGGSSGLWAYDPQDGFYVREELPTFGPGAITNPQLITSFAGQVVFAAEGTDPATIGDDILLTTQGLFAYAGNPAEGPRLVQAGATSEIVLSGGSLFAVVDGTLYQMAGPGAAAIGIGGVSAVRDLWDQDGTLYFIGEDGSGQQQAFRYAGFGEVVQLTDFAPGDTFSNLRDVVVTASGAVFLSADVANAGASGEQDTGLLVRIQDGTISTFGAEGFEGDQNVRSLIAVGDSVYFIGTDISGQERLWLATDLLNDDGTTSTIITNLGPEAGVTGSFQDADASITSRELVAFQGGVLASFARTFELGLPRVELYFSDGGPMQPVDPTLFNPSWVQVVDGTAYFVSANDAPELPGADFDGAEVYAYDGTAATQLTQHDPFAIDELRVLNRDQLFVTSPTGNSEVFDGSFVFEYNLRSFGNGVTRQLEERVLRFDTLFDAGDGGLHFTLQSPNGAPDRHFFIGSDSNAPTPIDGAPLGTNDDRGFFGGLAPYAAFSVGAGQEVTLFAGALLASTVDAIPGPQGIFPFSVAQTSDGTLYTAGTDALGIRRIYQITDGGVTTVAGLAAQDGDLGGTANSFLYEVSANSGGATVIKGVFDSLGGLRSEYWFIDGSTATATRIDDDSGFLFRTERAEVGGFLFYEDENANAAGGNQLGIFDTEARTLQSITINADSDADVRELVALGGAVYMRAVTEGVGFAGDLELVRVTAAGVVDVIDLRLDVGGFLSSAPRQITAVGDVLVALGDGGSDRNFSTPTLYEVTWTGSDAAVTAIDLGSFGISGVPFLEGGTEVLDGRMYFFAQQFGDIGLFSYDPTTDTVANIAATSGLSELAEFEYQMEVADGLLWFTFDDGFGAGMELYSYDPITGTVSSPLTDFNTAALGYSPFDLAVVPPIFALT